jgi:ABC-type transport system substrate-binding protein
MVLRKKRGYTGDCRISLRRRALEWKSNQRGGTNLYLYPKEFVVMDSHVQRAVDTEALSRRAILGVGAGGVAGLAGCGGTSSPTPIPDDGAGAESGAERTVVSRVAWEFAVGDSEWNRFSAAANRIPQREAFMTPMVSYNPATNETYYELADGPPTMEGCTLHVELEDDFTWWDGTDVTARDRAIPHSLIPYFCCGGPDEVPWVSEFVSTYEFKEEKIGKLSQTFAEVNMMSPLPGKADQWEPYIERLEDATTDTETQNIVQEIRNLHVSIDDAIEEGLGYGLWKPVEYTSSKLVLEKHDEHPYADRTNVERWEWRVVPTTQSFVQAFKRDRFDYGSSLYENNVQQVPENIEEVISYPSRFGLKMGLNWRNKHLARRPVRRAINYLLDLNDLASIAGNVSPLTQQTAGTPDSFASEWLGEAFLEEIISYGPEGRPEKAAQVMREAGYEKRGGVWTDPDGEQMTGLRFVATSSGDNALVGDTISGILSDFGIRTDFSALEGGSYRDLVSPRTGSGDFDLAIHSIGASLPHPARVWGYRRPQVVDAFAQPLNQSPAEGCSTDPPTVEYNEDTAPVFSIPVNPTPGFPDRVGRETLGDDVRHLDPVKHSTQMRFDVGRDRIEELARTFAWWVNFNAFHVYLHTTNRQMWLDTERLEVTEDPRFTGTVYGSCPLGHGDVSLR